MMAGMRKCIKLGLEKNMQNEKIDICITSYFRSEFTAQCLEKLKKHTNTLYRVIVGDNGSDMKTRDMLWDYYEKGLIDELVLLSDNIGLEPLKNMLLHHVRSSLFTSTDNDILVPPLNEDGDWLSRLIKLMETDQELAAIALTPQIFIGADKNEMFKDSPEVLERDFVGGSMRLMRTSAVRDVGGWRSDPKDMNEANRGEEKYICGKLKEKGYKVGYARDIEAYHLFGEDEEWGYGNVEHYHRDQWPKPKDSNFISYAEWYENL